MLSAHTIHIVVATPAYWLTTCNMLDKYLPSGHSLISVVLPAQGVADTVQPFLATGWPLSLCYTFTFISYYFASLLYQIHCSWQVATLYFQPFLQFMSHLNREKKRRIPILRISPITQGPIEKSVTQMDGHMKQKFNI